MTGASPWHRCVGRPVPSTQRVHLLAPAELPCKHAGRALSTPTPCGMPTTPPLPSVLQKKGAQLNAAIEARAGDSWPKAKAAAGSAFEAARRAALSGWAAARKAALAAWHSDALAAVRPTLGAAAQRGAAQARQVQAELEELLIR